MTQFFSGIVWLLKHPNTKNPYLALFKVVWWKFNQRFFKLPVLVEIIKGKYLLCPVQTDYASMIVYSKWPEYKSMAYLLKNLKNNSVFVDIGAGIGEHSILAASKISKGKIIAFEPDDNSFKTLMTNIRLNDLNKTILAEQLVVAQKNGYIGFKISKTSELNKISYAKKAKRKRAINLDSYCQNNKIGKIDLLKIDVEGAELLILRGAKKILGRKKIAKIILELNPNCINYNFSMEDTLNFLTSLGYKLLSDDQQIIKDFAAYLNEHQETNTIFAELNSK